MFITNLLASSPCKTFIYRPLIRPVDKLHAGAPTRPSPSIAAPQEGHVLQPTAHVHILRIGPRTAVRMMLTNAKGIHSALGSLYEANVI